MLVQCPEDFEKISFLMIRPPFLEGHGDLVNTLMMGIIGAIFWLIGVINLLTKSP